MRLRCESDVESDVESEIFITDRVIKCIGASLEYFSESDDTEAYEDSVVSN
jgi:hypothetical protein